MLCQRDPETDRHFCFDPAMVRGDNVVRRFFLHQGGPISIDSYGTLALAYCESGILELRDYQGVVFGRAKPAAAHVRNLVKDVCLAKIQLPKPPGTKWKINQEPTTEQEHFTVSLARQWQCFDCHQTTSDGSAPSFLSIAKRYRNDKAAFDRLPDVIRKGGSTNWGTNAKPGTEHLSIADAVELTMWILDLK